jgi:hypothetical protein
VRVVGRVVPVVVGRVGDGVVGELVPVVVDRLAGDVRR